MKVTAIFSDGTQVVRNTTRPLTHAYLVRNQWQTFTGFASSESLAKKAVVSDSKHGTVEHSEIVEVTI